jgi:hypothetical protein
MSVWPGIKLSPEVTTPVIPAGWVLVHVMIAPGVGELIFIGAEVAPEQIVCAGSENCKVGAGFTVIVNVFATPLQLLYLGLTVMVATTGLEEAFVAVKVGILPVPDGPNPILVFVLLQVNPVPTTLPLKLIGPTVTPLHTVLFGIESTVDVGSTVIVNESTLPKQVILLLANSVDTLIFPNMEALVVFVAVKAGILPVPLDASPIFIFVFVQRYTVPETRLLNVIALVVVLLHTV